MNRSTNRGPTPEPAEDWGGSNSVAWSSGALGNSSGMAQSPPGIPIDLPQPTFNSLKRVLARFLERRPKLIFDCLSHEKIQQVLKFRFIQVRSTGFGGLMGLRCREVGSHWLVSARWLWPRPLVSPPSLGFRDVVGLRVRPGSWVNWNLTQPAHFRGEAGHCSTNPPRFLRNAPGRFGFNQQFGFDQEMLEWRLSDLGDLRGI